MLEKLRGRGLAAAKPKDVALALSEYRRLNGRTLRETSEITGVSVGTLSKLENQKGTPSFRTLTRIIQLLDLSGGGPPDGEQADAIHPSARKAVTRESEILTAESDRAVMHIHASELLKKAMFPMVAQITLRDLLPMNKWSRHAGDEFVYVLSGEIEVHMEHYRPYVLREGESTYYDSGMRHLVISVSPEDAMVLSVSTSRWSQ